MEQANMITETSPSTMFTLFTVELFTLSNRKVVNKKLINEYLNKLNVLDYRYISVKDPDAVPLLLHQLCATIKSSETELVKNYSEFVLNIIRAGGKIIGKTFCTCQKWFLEALEYAQPDVRNNILTTLQALWGIGSFDTSNQSLQRLLSEKGLLNQLAYSANYHWSETNFLALSCIEVILVNTENNAAMLSLEYKRIVQEMVLNNLSSLSYDIQDKLIYNKLVCCCLRILCKLTTNASLMSEKPDSVGKILGAVKGFLFHGIEEYSVIKPQCLRPAAMNLPEVVYNRGNNTRNKTRPKRQAPMKLSLEERNNGNLSEAVYCKYSSDSETESLNPIQIEYKVRLEAVNLLHAATRNIPAHDMFGYWSQIVASGSKDSARVLTRLLLKEPVAKVRRTILSTLSKLLVKAKNFLVHADDSEHPSFQTFFGTVGAMIRELHLVLSLVLSCERNGTVLIHALKCTSGLVNGTPYARLKPGLASKLSRNSRPYLLHKDPTVRVSALLVFEALALVNPFTAEIVNILRKESKLVDNESFLLRNHNEASGDNEDNEYNNEEEVVDLEYAVSSNEEAEIESEIDNGSLRETGGLSFLLQVCLQYISNEAEKGPVRLHSLKLLDALALNLESPVFGHLEPVTTMLARVAQDTDFQVAYHACRVIETLAGRLAISPPENVNAVAFWNTVFSKVTFLVQHSQSTLREAMCDCLGKIDMTIFSQLPRERSILVITILFGGMRDEESGVRAAAVRALGMLVIMPALEEDTGFLMDLADIVCLAMEDDNLGVRVKACWTLANLCDCLIRRKNNEAIEPIPEKVLLPRLYSIGIKAAEDNCKVKCNAMRAVGSVIRLSADEQILNDVSVGLRVLTKCALSEKDMKVRWNACRALGFVINYKPDEVLPSLWRDQVLPTLCDLICNSPNFKVRTNAAWALAACDTYGKFGPSVWKSIVVALENSQHVPSFVEYPHRDVLVQQLCLTLCHVASRTSVSDLQLVWSQVRDHVEDITRHMEHLLNSVLPEKADDLVEAKTHLRKLHHTTNSEDKLIAHSLASLFEKINFHEDSANPNIKPHDTV